MYQHPDHILYYIEVYASEYAYMKCRKHIAHTKLYVNDFIW